ncbi:MAG: cytochrome C biogenesis protein ResB, partial [Chthoniobacterales bacterium]
SQASWNPQNLSESTIQILRDPGWSLKWIGSLLIVTGVFLMFYVKRFRRPAGQGKTTRREARPAEVMAA